MILQALKNMYPKASEKVLRAVMKDLEKCRGKNMSTEELADWIGKLVTAHTIEEAYNALFIGAKRKESRSFGSTHIRESTLNYFFKTISMLNDAATLD